MTILDPGAPTRSVERHVAAMRRQRRWYFAILAVIVTLVAVGVAAVWSRAEIAHAHLRTVESAPASVPPAEIAAGPAMRWHSADPTALGAPLAGGTIVTYATHTVRGRDARTGSPTWSYTRSDRSLCDVVQLEDRTVAIFDHNGNCDEVSAFVTSTGRRAWERTLDSEGHAIDGRPQVTAVVDTVLLTTPSAVHAIDPVSGLDRWNFVQPSGCSTRGVALGSGGALIGQQCTDGDHLLLRDRYSGEDNDKTTKWRIPSAAVPASADTLLAAIDPATGRLLGYDPRRGAVRTSVSLRPTPSGNLVVQQSTTVTAELIWVGGRCYAVRNSGTDLLWSAAVATLPSVTPTAVGAGQADLATSLLLVPTTTGVDLLDGATGRARVHYPVADMPAADTVVTLGSGFLLAGPSTTVVQ